MANQTEQLARLLPALGIDVAVVRTNEPASPPWVGRVRGLRAVVRLLPYVMRLWRTVGRSDLVHVMANSGWSWILYAVPAILVARLRGVPVLVNYRGGGAQPFLERYAWHVRPLIHRCDLLAVPSGFLVKTFEHHGMQAVVLPNFIDLTRFTRQSEPPRRPTILVARNLEPIYDIATALRAAARLRKDVWDLQMIVAGEGPEAGPLSTLARELGLESCVRFTGRVANQEMPALYRQASVVVNPSRVDNTPISILEALASGVPVVTTAVGGIPYLVEDGTSALLVRPGDPDAMAAAIARAIGDGALRSELAAGARSVVCAHDWGVVGARIVRTYRAIAERADVALPA